MIRQERPIVDLLKSDTIVINDLLADYYGIEKIYGSHFREDKVPEKTPQKRSTGDGCYTRNGQ